MITVSGKWSALLDADEDDFTFWQYGFSTWADGVALYWFKSAEAFLAQAQKMEQKPIAVVLDGIMPPNEEKVWLSEFLGHDCCQRIPIFILSGQYQEQERSDYLEIGATEYLIKPTSIEELKTLVLKVNNNSSALSTKSN